MFTCPGAVGTEMGPDKGGDGAAVSGAWDGSMAGWEGWFSNVSGLLERKRPHQGQQCPAQEPRGRRGFQCGSPSAALLSPHRRHSEGS